MTARRAAGFTLIEVLVAMVVLGALFASLSQGLNLELAAWRTQMRLAGPQSDLDTVDRAIRRLIAHMDPGVSLEPPLLVAEPHTLAFTTELPEAAGAVASVAADVSLGVDAAHQLVLRWRSHFPGGEAGPATEMELLRGVDHVDFSYWRPGAGGEWLPRWSDPESLPALIRVKLVFPSASRRDFPPILAAPMRERPH